MIGIIKFAFAIIFLPLVVAVAMGFDQELTHTRALQDMFWLGVLTYTLWHLFIFSFGRLFDVVQKGFSELFRFSVPVQAVVPRIIPLGPALLLTVYYICSSLFRLKGLDPVIVFFTGFTLALHVILTAANLYEEDQQVLKPHYFLIISLAFVANLFVVSLLLDVNLGSFSFLRFWDLSLDNALKNYRYILHRFVL